MRSTTELPSPVLNNTYYTRPLGQMSTQSETGCGYTRSIVGLIEAITAVPNLRCLDDCDEWCVGLPFERIRVLDACELDLLQHDVNTQYRRQRAYAVSCACLFVLLYLSAILMSTSTLFWLTAIDGALMAVFVLWLVSDPASWLRRNRALQADILAGIVHCFHHEACAGSLEVLPRAEVVYTPNEFSPRKWRRAKIGSTAKIPAIASIATEWLQPVEGSSGHFLAGKRALSRTEIGEISRCIEEAWSAPKRYGICCICWMMFVVWMWRSGSYNLFFGSIALTALGLVRLSPDVIRAVALLQDVKGGHVIINRRASIQDSAVVPIGTASEYLPKAREKWTEAGRLAEWRKFV
jgi:hypothetical protein